MKKFATDASLGLDTQSFNACVDQDKYMQRVEDEKIEGQKNRVKATPTFFLDGEMIEGMLPFPEFQKRIDAALSKKQ